MGNTYRDDDFHDLQIESDPGDDTTRIRTPALRQAVLAYLRSHPDCTAEQIAHACGITRIKSVGDHIGELRHGGYVIHTVHGGRKGRGNPTTYRIEETIGVFYD